MLIVNDISLTLRMPTAIALGTFDGLHAGHRAVIKAAVDAALAESAVPAVFTFSTLPKNAFLPPEEQIRPLLTFGEKASLIRELGVELLFAPAFTRELASVPAESFVRDILIGRLCAKHVVCGYDHRFGAHGAGDPSLLFKLCAEAGVGVTVVPPVVYKGEKLSSTLIRKLLEEGRRAEADELMGR